MSDRRLFLGVICARGTFSSEGEQAIASSSAEVVQEYLQDVHPDKDIWVYEIGPLVAWPEWAAKIPFKHRKLL